MRGASKQAQPYIGREDREAPEDERTMAFIRLKNHEDANQSQRRYGRTRRESRPGTIEIDAGAMNKADIEDAVMVIESIGNYAFSEEYLEQHPEIQSRCNEKGFLTDKVSPSEEAGLFRDIMRDLTNESFMEFIAASESRTKLEEGHPKNFEPSSF